MKTTNNQDIASLLTRNFQKNSSSNNYSIQFQNIKRGEKKNQNSIQKNKEGYNQLFCLSKLIDSEEITQLSCQS